MLTVAAKVTFQLREGRSVLAPDADPIFERDEFVNQDETKSLAFASDLVPLKRMPEVLVVGAAHPPKRTTASSVLARLIVGSVDKTVAVHGECVWDRHGVFVQRRPVAPTPLQWELAGGGPGTNNPAGMSSELRDGRGDLRLPSFMPQGFFPSAPGEVVPPAGFGPIAATWPIRATRLQGAQPPTGTAGAAAVLPNGVDAAYFNVAPSDQHLDELRGDESLVLENLVRNAPRLVTSLPSVELSAMFEHADRAPLQIPLSADTLWIDTDRARCSIVWRGQIALPDPRATGRVVVRASAASAPLDPPRYDLESTSEIAAEDIEVAADAETGERPQAMPTPALSAGLPFRTQPGTEWSSGPSAQLGALPTLRRAASAIPPAPPSSSSIAMGPASHAHPSIAIPPAPPSVPIMAPPVAIASQQPFPAEVGQKQYAPEVGQKQYPMPPLEVRTMELKRSWVSAAAASNAAVHVEPAPVAPVPEPAAAAGSALAAPQTALQVLWVASEAIPRIVCAPAWVELLGTSRGDDDDPIEEPDAADEAQVHYVLAKGAASSLDTIGDRAREAIDRFGAFTPPMVLVEGEITFAVAPIETLRRMCQLSTLLAGSDKRVAEAVEAVKVTLEALGDPCPPATVDSLRAKLNAALTQSGKIPAGPTVQEQAEQMSLRSRTFDARQVLGKKYLVGRLTRRGETRGLLVYLPEEVAGTLPLATTLSVRIVGELVARQDFLEEDEWALVAGALARSLTFG